MQIIKINPEEYGLTDETAKNISSQFQPMLDKMVELEAEFNEVVQLPLEDFETTKRAKELRLRYVKIRTATAEIHKKQKAFYLNGGRYIDGWKNAQVFASQGKEQCLEDIENYLLKKELERQEKLHNERIELIRPFVDDTTALNLGNMEDDVWDAFLTAKRQAHFERIQAEALAKQKREQDEAAEKLHNDRKTILLDYWHLIDDSYKRINFGAMTTDYFNAFLSDLVRQKTAYDTEQERLKKEYAIMQQEKLKALEEAKRLEEELKNKIKQEEEEKQARLLAEDKARKEAQKLAKAPIKKQLKAWVDSFDIADCPIHHQTGVDIIVKFEAFKKWAKLEIENI